MLLQLSVILLQTPPAAGSSQVESGFNFVIAAYAVVWILVFGYIYTLNRRQARLRRDIQTLQAEENERKQQLNSNQEQS